MANLTWTRDRTDIGRFIPCLSARAPNGIHLTVAGKPSVHRWGWWVRAPSRATIDCIRLSYMGYPESEWASSVKDACARAETAAAPWLARTEHDLMREFGRPCCIIE